MAGEVSEWERQTDLTSVYILSLFLPIYLSLSLLPSSHLFHSHLLLFSSCFSRVPPHLHLSISPPSVLFLPTSVISVLGRHIDFRVCLEHRIPSIR